MTMFVVPRLLQRVHGRSAIINLSSKAAFYTRGFMPMYCATKHYNYMLSECMRDAYELKGIDVLTVTPSAVETNMNPGKGSYKVKAPAHARAVIDQLGRQN